MLLILYCVKCVVLASPPLVAPPGPGRGEPTVGDMLLMVSLTPAAANATRDIVAYLVVVFEL